MQKETQEASERILALENEGDLSDRSRVARAYIYADSEWYYFYWTDIKMGGDTGSRVPRVVIDALRAK